jgi:hypothetical protein
LLTVLDDTGDDQNFTHCLPVFYVNLDPARIPTDDNLTTGAVARAVMTFKGLHEITDSHKPAWRDLWPRIWAWIVFLHAYWDCLPTSFAKSDVCLDFLFFMNRFRSDPDTHTLVGKTVGVRSLVMAAWSFLLHSKDRGKSSGFDHLYQFLYSMRIEESTNLAEVIDGRPA